MYDLKSYAFAAAVLLVGLVCFLQCTDARLRARYGKLFMGLLLVTQAAAFMSPNALIYNSVVGIAIFLVCKDRRLIAPVYLFLLLTLPMPTKTIIVGGTYIMGFEAAMSLALGGAFAVLARSRGRFPRSPQWDILAVILFLVYALPSMRGSTGTNILRVFLENITTILLPYYVISRSMRSFEDLRDAVYGLLAAISALSTLAMYEAYRTWPLYRAIPDHYGISGGFMAVKMRGGLLRTYGPFPESTSFALCLTTGLIIAYGSRRLFANPMKRNIVLLIMLLGALAPQSRGAWIGLILGIAAVDLFEGRTGALIKKAVAGGVVIGLLIAGATAIPALRKLPGMSGEGGDTVDYRSQLFDRGVEEIRRHPIAGRSPVNVMAAMEDMRQGEGIIDFVNTYLYVALIAGIPGLLGFLYMFGRPLAALWNARRSLPRRLRARFVSDSGAAAVFGSIIGMMAMIAVTSMISRTLTLIVIQMGCSAVILNAVAAGRRQMRKPSSAEPERADAAAPPAALPARA